MPLGMSVQLVRLLSTTMIYCSLGTSHRMSWDVKEKGNDLQRYHRVLQTDAVRTDGYLEAALEQVLARDYVCDFGLVQTVSDSRWSQGGIQGDDCEIQAPLGLSFLYFCCHKCACIRSLLTWEVVHEAGLSRHNPLCSSLTEDGDVTLRLLAQSS